MTARTFTDEQAMVLRREYEAGKNYREIAEQFATSENTARKTVLRAGGKSRAQTKEERPDLIAPRRFPKVDDCVLVRDEYLLGYSMKELAEKYSCNIRTIGNAIERAGGGRRPLGRPSSWTEQLVNKAIADYRSGRDLRETAREIGIGHDAIRAKLKYMKVWVAVPRLRGEAHGSWKGGRRTAEGYVWVKPSDEDLKFCVPNSSGYVAEHRLVMGRALGRPLLSSETVHHKNGVRHDNRYENLQLRQGKHGKHNRWVCGDCGSHNLIPADI